MRLHSFNQCFLVCLENKRHFIYNNISTSYIIYIVEEVSQQIKRWERASLVVQWLGICLPMQGTRVRALGQEDSTCRGAAEPVRHNY